MSLKQITPCDCVGLCPYDAEYNHDCEYWCGADEPEDYPEDYDQEEYKYESDNCDYEIGYDPYAGCFTDDC